MLAALNFETIDHPPCSFMLFRGLQTQSRDYIDFIEQQVVLGLDAYVMLPPRPPVVVNDYYNLHGISASYAPEVKIKEWVEQIAGESTPILVKEYHTSAGTLRAEVRQRDDWRWRAHIPF